MHPALNLLTILVLLFSSCEEKSSPFHFVKVRSIYFEEAPPKGKYVIYNVKKKSKGQNGLLKIYNCVFPKYEKALYFNLLKTDSHSFPFSRNNVMPIIVEDFKREKEGGMFLLLKINESKYLAICPVAGDQSISWFSPTRLGNIDLKIGTLGTQEINNDLPFFSWAYSPNPYEACHLAWAEALKFDQIKKNTSWRSNKLFSDIFNYIGWTTKGVYKNNINEPILKKAFKNIEKSNIPIRYVLIDNGYQSLNTTNMITKQLISLKPDKIKFPNEWKSIISLKKENKIKWVGLLCNIQGYSGTFAKNNELGELNNYLDAIRKDIYLPKQDEKSANKFYDSYIKSVSDYGFDFIKLTNLTENLNHYKGLENAVTTSKNNILAIENATRKYNLSMINNSAQNLNCIFNTKWSSITASSIGYRKGATMSAKQYFYQSYSNTMWLGHTVYPDNDILYTNDKYGKMMSISKAMSCGPLYLSDSPSELKKKNIMPLIYNDGKIIKPLAPSVPLPSSIFLNPLVEKKPFVVVAPSENNTATYIAYNLVLNKDEKIVATFSPKDYSYSNQMLQPYQEPLPIPVGGVILYDPQQNTVQKFIQDYEVKLDNLSDYLIHVYPINKGWAVIGRTDKYIAPATVKIINIEKNKIEFTLKEKGPFSIWHRNGKPVCDGIRFISKGNGLWNADIPIETKPWSLTVKLSHLSK